MDILKIILGVDIGVIITMIIICLYLIISR